MPKKILKIISTHQPVYLDVYYTDTTAEKLGPYDSWNTPYEHDTSGRDVDVIKINTRAMHKTSIDPPLQDPSNPRRTYHFLHHLNLAMPEDERGPIPPDGDLLGIVSINAVAVEMREN